MSEPKTAEVTTNQVEHAFAALEKFRDYGYAQWSVGAAIDVIRSAMLAASPPAETGEGEPFDREYGGGTASGMSDLEWAVYTAAYSILRDYENHPLKDRGLINAGDQRIPKLIAAQVVEQMAALASKGV